MSDKKARIASLIDHALLAPSLSDEELIKGCHLADQYKTASVCVKPCHVAMARDALKNSPVLVGTVIGFPQGGHTLKTKLVESEEAIKQGADDLDIVVNIGKIFSRDWTYLEKEIKELTHLIQNEDKIIKVIFETGLLAEKQIVELVKICESSGADYIKTSTGFCYIKDQQGVPRQSGAEIEKVEIMLREASHCKVKASGGIKNWEQAWRFHSMGVSRLGTSSTAVILSN